MQHGFLVGVGDPPAAPVRVLVGVAVLIAVQVGVADGLGTAVASV